MEIVQADQYRVRDNWLYFPKLNLDPIRIPFGLGLGTRRRPPVNTANPTRARAPRPRLRLQAEGRLITVLDVETRRSWRPVLPPFSRIVRGTRSRGPTFIIQTAMADAERSTALEIVKRAHYLNARPGGVILLAHIADPRIAHKVRAQWWSRLPREVKARYGTLKQATVGLTDVVGALHLERLMHGHPLGRTAIYQREGKRPPDRRAMKRPGFRWRVVSELGLYWISRIAVEVPFQGLGIGSALCDAAREVAATRTLEPGRYVELIRRLPITQFKEVQGVKGDFLTGFSTHFACQLPFILRTPYLSRKPARAWNAERSRWEPLPAPDKTGLAGDCLAYYYARAGSMVIGSRPRRGRRKGARR
jgi:GNAT superfamily N-acetyltransferase